MPDEDIPHGGLDDEDAALKAELMAMLQGAAKVEDDTSKDGIVAPLDPLDVPKTMVELDEGLQDLENARLGKTKPAEPAADIDAQIAAKPAEVALEPAPVAATPAPVATEVDFVALLDGVPDDRKQVLTERLTAGNSVLDLFKGREAELAIHGADVTPAKAVDRLLYLNDFAQEKPDEYLAWVAQQVHAEAPHEVLEAAAKHLGYKLVPDIEDDPDDEFADDEKKALKAQLKALQGSNTPIGPDAPQNRITMQVNRALTSFREARGADGQPLHPLHGNFVSEIAAKVRDYRSANPDKIPTAADLSRFYFEVVPGGAQPAPVQNAAPAAPAAAAPVQTNAAQPQPVVQKQTQTAAAARSEAASKMLDGSGPGSDRRPAHPGLSGDALLRAQLQETLDATKSE